MRTQHRQNLRESAIGFPERAIRACDCGLLWREDFHALHPETIWAEFDRWLARLQNLDLIRRGRDVPMHLRASRIRSCEALSDAGPARRRPLPMPHANCW